MSDQKKLLFVAGLMAIVLFVSWQLLGGSGSDEEEVIEAPAESLIQTPEAETSVPIDEEPVADVLESDSLSGPMEYVDRDITVIIKQNGEDLVAATFSTSGGAVSSWKLLEYEDMPGSGQDGFVDFNGAPWLSFLAGPASFSALT